MNQSQEPFVHPAARPPIQHDDLSVPLTLTRQTDIRMPIPEEETRFTAFFVLDENVSPKMIDEILESVYQETEVFDIWLADTILPDGLTEEDDEATVPPVDESWQSPFVGQSVEEAFRFLATVPLEKSLNRTFIVVLNKALYNRKKWLVLYSIDERGEITSAPCAAHMAMVYINSYNWHIWPELLDKWRKHGKPVF